MVRSDLSGPNEAITRARYVYVMTRGPYCKVGISAKPKSRASKLRESSPEPIEIAFTIRPPEGSSAREVEARAHAHLAPWRTRGEWFKCDAELAIMVVRHSLGPMPEATAAYFAELAIVDALGAKADTAFSVIPSGSTRSRGQYVADARSAYEAWDAAHKKISEAFPDLHREARPHFDLAL